MTAPSPARVAAARDCEIRLLKGIHDALHEIEAKCLMPLAGAAAGAGVGAGAALPPEGFRRKFVQLHNVIRALLAELAPTSRTARLAELAPLLEGIAALATTS